MTPKKVKIRPYRNEYFELGVIQYPGDLNKPYCIFCLKIYSNDSMRLKDISEHFYRYHEEESETPLRYFELKKESAIEEYAADYSNTSCSEKKYVEVSLSISLMIAKCGNPTR